MYATLTHAVVLKQSKESRPRGKGKKRGKNVIMIIINN